MYENTSNRPPARWRNFLLKGTIWLSSELVLGFMGMDNIADYGEFLAKSRVLSHATEAITTITTLI